ncbi:SDR family oxidoreductase [Myxococcota bacterium]|nr:SDR family oxidoreductase [Myxococcota bacterium]
MIDLVDRVILVTGGARGVGRAIAEGLAAQGARIVIGDILVEAGQAVAKGIGGSARFEKLDVSQEADWARVVGGIVAREGRIDALVNNAAALHIGTIENTPLETFRRIQDVNLIGPFLGTRAVVPSMKKQGKGAIVHIGSIDGMIGMNGICAYAASKWGLRGLAKSNAIELGRAGIRVNTICPAGGNGEMFLPWAGTLANMTGDTEEYLTNRGIPGDTPFSAIANAVAYLVSDASENVTGIDLPVDGGAASGRFLPGFNNA